MKKDIEWLKEAVGELNLVVTEFEADGVSYIDTAVSVTQVYDLIDQLEEPDERTQLEEAYKDILERHIFYYNKTKYQVIKEQIIPRFVADWIDAHDLHGNNPLREYRDLEIDFDEGWTNEKDAAVYHWVNENPYAFIDALRYGYEIAKEKLYVVELIDNHLTCWLAYDLVNKVFFMSQNQKEKLNKFKKRFTEQEIKDHDERYIPFMVPVDEVNND